MSVTKEDRHAVMRKYSQFVDDKDPRIMDFYTYGVELFNPKFGYGKGKVDMEVFSQRVSEMLNKLTHEIENPTFIDFGKTVVVEAREWGLMSDGSSSPTESFLGEDFATYFVFGDRLFSASTYKQVPTFHAGTWKESWHCDMAVRPLASVWLATLGVRGDIDSNDQEGGLTLRNRAMPSTLGNHKHLVTTKRNTSVLKLDNELSIKHPKQFILVSVPVPFCFALTFCKFKQVAIGFRNGLLRPVLRNLSQAIVNVYLIHLVIPPEKSNKTQNRWRGQSLATLAHKQLFDKTLRFY